MTVGGGDFTDSEIIVMLGENGKKINTAHQNHARVKTSGQINRKINWLCWQGPPERCVKNDFLYSVIYSFKENSQKHLSSNLLLHSSQIAPVLQRLWL